MVIRPTRAHPHQYPALEAVTETIQATFARAVAANPDATYAVDEDVRLTLAEMARRAGSLQTRLREAGVGPGDVVTLQLPNWWETIAAMHATWGLGAIVNPVTPIYRGTELQGILATSRPKAVLAPADYRELDYSAMIAGALAAVGHEASVLTVREPNRADSCADEFEFAAADPDDVAMLMYTSGTTGRPKGVLHSHRTLLYEAQSISDTFGLRADSIFMPSPLTHITGLLYGVLMPLQLGGRVVLMDRWDPDAAVRLIEHDGCTATVSATPFLRGLADSYTRAGIQSSLHTFVCGGADIPATLVATALAVMGTSVARTYGSTEMPTLCIVRPDDAGQVRLATEGRVIGEAEARLASEVDGVGELEVRGPELFVGYLDPQDNQAAFTADGWFRTGDLARIAPTGEVAIVGRLKDVIVRGGENISAKEVEDLLMSHAAIRDVAIVGIPDDVMGERACAVVVTDRESLDLADLTSHLATSGIAKQKYPEALYIVPELPRTVSGKVQKFQLREQTVIALAEGRVQTRQ